MHDSGWADFWHSDEWATANKAIWLGLEYNVENFLSGGQLSNRREEADSSGKTPDGVTSPGESKVNPETCKNKVLARGYDLEQWEFEVMIDIDNHEQS